MSTQTIATCRICGCTDSDCSWCITLAGVPCSWAEIDLCNVCAAAGQNDPERARSRGRCALELARRRRGLPGTPELRQHGYQCLRVAARAKAVSKS